MPELDLIVFCAGVVRVPELYLWCLNWIWLLCCAGVIKMLEQYLAVFLC